MFRIGSTSYVIPDHIVPNVEFLGPLVDDVQLVLFETDEHGSNLPDAGQVSRLNELAQEHELTYTVHLPLDLRLGDDGGDGDISLVKARRVIDATRGLDPHAYTLHLDGRCLMSEHDGEDVVRWQEASGKALGVVSDWLNDPTKLGIENLEAWDPEAFAPLVQALPVGRTIDVGHLWLQGLDPIDHLERWIDRARVVHLHGIAERDHASLSNVAPADLDRVTNFLLENFAGVVTLEVFNVADLRSSLDVLAGSMRRAMGGRTWERV
jgi:sugar phosphate isomerase/epimerase